MSPTLAVVAGPHAGASVSLAGGPVTIGRSPRCGLVLPDADTSRRHAVAEARDGSIVVHDLGSTNGTTIDGAPVGVVPAVVRRGTRLRIGESELTPDWPERVGDDPVALLRAVEAGRCRAGPGMRVRLGQRAGEPVGHDFATASLAVAGPYAGGLAWWLLAQLAAAHPPSELRVALLAPRSPQHWSWAARLPHVHGGVLGDGARALELARRGPPTLLVADLRGADPAPSAMTSATVAPATAASPLRTEGVACLALGGMAELRCDVTATPRGDTGTRLCLDDGPSFVLDAVGESWASRLALALAGVPVGA